MTMTDFDALDSAWAEVQAQAEAPPTPVFQRGVPASGTDPRPARGQRPNRYAGVCTSCGNRVEAEAGLLGDKVNGQWTVRHADGQCPEAAPEAPSVEVPEGGFFPDQAMTAGTYTVTLDDGSHRTFRVVVQSQDDDFAPGETVIQYLVGRDNEKDYKGFGFVQAGRGLGSTAPRLAVWRRFREGHGDLIAAAQKLMADPEAEGDDVLKTVNCVRCNAKLSRPDSIGRNLGPDCAREWGW